MLSTPVSASSTETNTPLKYMSLKFFCHWNISLLTLQETNKLAEFQETEGASIERVSWL